MKRLLLLLIFLIQPFTLIAKEGSVVCLHGYFRSYKCMIPMGNVFRREGVDVYLWDYQSKKETIETHAANLVEVLNKIALEKPGEPIHFTTHSFGGIIVRAAVNHPDCPDEAKMGKAVLLAPPNKGAHLARHFQHSSFIRWFLGKKSGRQLLTYDEEDMESVGAFPETMSVLVLAGAKDSRLSKVFVREPNDGKVTVEETRLSTPHHHMTLYVGHHWIMTSRESIAITRDFILAD